MASSHAVELYVLLHCTVSTETTSTAQEDRVMLPSTRNENDEVLKKSE